MLGEWREVTVGEFAPFAYGKGLPEHLRDPAGNIPVFGSNGVVGTHSEALTSGPAVIIGRKGTVGAVHYSPRPCWPIDTTFYLTDPDPAVLRFKYYVLKSLGLEHMNADSAVPGLNREAAHGRKIRIPPLPEQRAIAHILGTLDDKIELNRRMSETLEQMARALFKAWFVDFEPVRAKMEGRWRRGQSLPGLPAHLYDLFPARLVDSELGEIPEGWRVGTISDCCIRIQNGGTPSRNNPYFWVEGNIPWLTSAEVRQPIVTATEHYITDAGMRASSAKWIDQLSTVIALYGATAGQVSLVALRLTTNQAVCALIPKPGFEFYNFFWMRKSVPDLEAKAVGSAQQNISKAIVEETCVLLPPEAVVKEFSKTVAPIVHRWILATAESRTLAALRDALLPKLISGELRVKDAERFLKERGL
jgi:type I restriction enzyme S subunit